MSGQFVAVRGVAAASLAGLATVGAVDVLPAAPAVAAPVVLSVLLAHRLVPIPQRPRRSLPPG